MERASHYRADRIVDELLRDVGLAASGHSLDDEAPMPREVSECDHVLSTPLPEVAGRRLA